MALSVSAFQNYLADWVDQVNSMIEDLETWAGNKADSTPNFDFTTAKSDLDTAKSNLQTSVTTVKAL